MTELAFDELGFNKHVDEGGTLVSVLATDEYSFNMIGDQICMTIDFHDGIIERLEQVLQEKYKSVGLLVKIEVAEGENGKGHGDRLMTVFKSQVSAKTDVDILFARIENKQAEGFCLRSFYEKRGFEAIKMDQSSLLMANKGQAKVIEGEIFPHRKIANESRDVLYTINI